jgi:hypothetical protein
MKIGFFVFALSLIALVASGQKERWQLAADYKMDIDFHIKQHQFEGKQQVTLWNNSPDTLFQLFYHLYFNAFQPNSAMDVRSRTIIDPDPRVKDRIVKLKKNEQGYLDVSSLRLNGDKVSYQVEGTILEVSLTEPVLPGSKVVLDMEFEGQVPLQIRRSGRFNKEGIEYSMAQWYPKLCNYDEQGWHANPYVGREFYGIWANFDVSITLPSNYVVAATGILQNKEEAGYGYAAIEPEKRPEKLTWRFKAERVHDFVWAADPDYRQIVHTTAEGLVVRCFFQPGEKTTENWEKLPVIMEEAFRFINQKYGKYPFSEYAFIQGGDGGMEYPMATLITGERSLRSLVGVAVHELMHSWYQMVLGSNEALYHWMDEGFTSYASNEVMNYLILKKMLPGTAEENPHLEEVKGYVNFALSGAEEALITHADHFQTNAAYGVASYTKGEVLLEQLRYIIGEQAFDQGMLRYFYTWQFRHPNANDFIRVMEKQSGMELDWFREYFVNTTHTIDYELEGMNGKNLIIRRKGKMPMPLDITVKNKNGKITRYTIPLDIMRGVKKGDRFFEGFKVAPDWTWSHPTYSLELEDKINDIQSIEIDSSQRLADVDRENNLFPRLLPQEGMDK